MKALSLVIFCLITLNLYNQNEFEIVPSSDCATCDGMLSFQCLAGNLKTYEWYDSENNLLFSETNDLGISSLNNLCQGLYSLTVADLNGTDSFSCSLQPDGFNLEQPVSSVICSTEENVVLSDYFTDLPLGTWSLNGIPYNNLPELAENLTPGEYLFVSDEACPLETSINVEINEPANPGLSTTYLICEDYVPFFMTDFLAGDPDYNGTWYDSDDVLSDGFFNPETMESELFTYEIDSVEGCEPVFSTLFVVKNFYSDPGLDTDFLICEDADQFDLTDALNGTPDINGQWWNSDLEQIPTSFDPEFDEPGTYIYVVSSSAPCPSQQSELNITFVEAIDAGSNAGHAVCSSDSPFEMISFLEGDPDLNGVWSDEANTNLSGIFDPAIMNAGNYTYTVSAFGCEDETAVLNVEVEEFQFIGTDLFTSVCDIEEEINLFDLLPEDVSTMGEWYMDSESIGESLESADLDLVELQYQIPAEYCLDQEILVELTVDPYFSAGESTTLELCETDDSFSLIDSLPSPEIDSGNWYFGVDLVSEQFNPSTDEQGFYQYIIEGIGTCPDSEAGIEIVIWEEVEISPPANLSLCDDIELVDIEFEANQDYSYFWSPQDYFIDPSESNPTLMVDELSLSDPQEFVMTAANGTCIGDFSILVEVHPLPNAELADQYQLCEDEDLIIQIDPDYEVVWSAEGITELGQNEFSLPNNNSSNYEVVLTDLNDCSIELDLDVIVHPNPEYELEFEDLSGCVPLSINALVSSNQNLEVLWYFDDVQMSEGLELNEVIEFGAQFELQFQVSNEFGCIDEYTFPQVIEAWDNPLASFDFSSEPSPAVPQIEFSNNSFDNTENLWYLEGEFASDLVEPTLEVFPFQPGVLNICLTVTNDDQCSDSICKFLVIDPQIEFYIPNAFTPDNDGTNDVFKPVFSGVKPEEFTFQVLDRWSNVLFETTEITGFWDGSGTLNSEYYAQIDQYVWIVEYRMTKGSEKFRKKGTVTLIR